MIKIDGVEYELPALDTVTLDECITVERESGLSFDQVELAFLDSRMHAGAIKGLLCIAVKRARPDVPDREISQVVGKLTLPELAKGFESEAEESPPPESPASETAAESQSSGDSGNGAGEPTPEQSTPASTGSPDSDTGFTSFHRTSAA